MKVVILDRDGVINVDSPDYIKSPDEWKPISGSIEAISLLSNNGVKVYIATNQAGVARGLFSSEALDAIHQKMHRLVQAAGGEIQGVFYCPHHPKDLCDCRKPNIGLLEQIADDFGESLKSQPFVGDSIKDIEAARKMGCRPILVKTGNGKDTLQTLGGSVECYDDLLSFARIAIRELGSNDQP